MNQQLNQNFEGGKKEGLKENARKLKNLLTPVYVELRQENAALGKSPVKFMNEVAAAQTEVLIAKKNGKSPEETQELIQQLSEKALTARIYLTERLSGIYTQEAQGTVTPERANVEKNMLRKQITSIEESMMA